MSYHRVVPRDLFNEASLLKCLGRLALMIEDQVVAGLGYEYDGTPFQIEQNPSNGAIYCTNLQFFCDGEPMELIRPLNSREPYPLYWMIDDNAVPVFDDRGGFILDPAY